MQSIFARYGSSDSPIGNLDPLVKWFALTLAIGAVLITSDWIGLLIVSGYVLILCRLCGGEISFYLRGISNFSWMLSLTFGLNLAFPRPGIGNAFSYAAMASAIFFTVRLALMILVAILLVIVLSPSEVGEAIGVFVRFGGRASRIGSDLGAIVTLALRFVPILLQEAERIRASQILRGRVVRGIKGRIHFAVDLIVPLIEASLRRATNLGYALEARCYGSVLPTPRPLRIARGELLMLFSSIVLVIYVALRRWL